MTDVQPDPSRLAIAWNEPAMIHIGKGGISESVIAETKRVIKRHKYVKVRLLRNTGADKFSKQGIFEQICGQTGATLAGIRGNTAVIYRLRK